MIILHRFLKSCCNNLLKSNGKPGLMGEEGEVVDSFFTKISRDVTNARLETFDFHDFKSC